MNTLNDDCQLLIIKYLDFKDQLLLFEATKGEPANRLNSNVRYIWQHKPDFTICDYQFLSTDNAALMDNFLSVISPTVQRLNLYEFTFGSLEAYFAPYVFPKVTTLDYTLDGEDAEFNGDLIMNLFAEIFPGLTSFSPCGVFKSVHLMNWMNLRQLDLSECSPPEGEFELEIEIADFKMLEELTLFHHGYDNISSGLMRLPKFRKFTYKSNDVGFPVGCRIKDIEKLSFNDTIYIIHPRTFKYLINLRQLSILGSEGPDEAITSEELQNLLKDLPQLDRLDLINNVQFCRREAELWKTVACCPSLKILNISSLWMGPNFFNINRRPMERVLDKRTNLLTLNCHVNGEYEHLARSYFKHPKLKVSFEPLGYNYICTGFIEIHFLPLQIATEEEDSS